MAILVILKEAVLNADFALRTTTSLRRLILSHGALVGAGDANHVFPTDFSGTPRQGSADIGAYRIDNGGNPGRTISAAFKSVQDIVAPIPPTDVQAN